MKLYLAAEAKLIAKNTNIKSNKKEFDILMEYVMEEISAASREGKYEVFVVVEDFRTTIEVVLKEMGYDVEICNENFRVCWK